MPVWLFWGGGIANNKHPEQEIIKNENVNLAIYLNEIETSSIPSKEGNVFDEEKSTCTNDAYIVWDYSSWSPIIKNVSNYPVRCNLYFKTGYSESILNGTDPILKDELIPVTISDDGTVRKADLGSKWYSYEEKIWANAVILKDETKDYKATEVIPEENIESYFVWIPKYRYQLWDLGMYDSLTSIDTSKVHEIPVIFGDYNTSDNIEGECTTPMESGATGNCSVGDYMTHPAFLSIPSKGFWVGKFETGYEGATSTIEAEANKRDASKIIVKPNVYSWRSINVANSFYTGYDYKRNLDSHIIKATEWGAIAYLQHSKYGSGTSVRINNNSDYVTGYAAKDEPTCGYTQTNETCNIYCGDESCANLSYPNSILASTTNNISGVFDLSGGSWEFVMGLMQSQSGEPMSGRNSLYNSGFNGPFSCPTCDGDTSGLTSLSNGLDFPESKYYDLYLYNNLPNEKYEERILGDATGETGPFNNKAYQNVSRRISSWHDDQADFLSINDSWFRRGALNYDGLGAGIFTFSATTGIEYNFTVFRLILTPN